MTVFALVAGACSNKKDEDSVSAADTEAPAETSAGSDTTAVATDDGGAETTVAADETTTTLAMTPVVGGKLIMAGEADVGNGWLPSVVQCDSFCHTRAHAFFDPLVTVDTEQNWHPFLAESVTPNADSTVFTIKLRPGIKFTDGTDLTADVAMFNFNNAAKSLLVGAALNDVARDADGNVVMEKIDDLTYTITTAVSWPIFPIYLAGQPGWVGSKKWIDDVAAGTADQTILSPGA